MSNDQPVPPGDILNVLQELSSQNPVNFNSAEEKLKEFGERLGTWDTVHQLANDDSLPIDLRKQALIQFKNCAVSRWRSRKCVFAFISLITGGPISKEFGRIIIERTSG
jgi:hypothetical protein